jgi:hypothetical protein
MHACRSFFTLILQKDAEVFGSGQAYFRDLESGVDWDMPSEQMIQQMVEHLHPAF